MPTGRTAPGSVAQGTSSTSIDASLRAARHSTTSTCTRSTAGIRGRRSRRRWRRCTTSCGRARRATSARRRCTPGSSRRRSTSRARRLDAVRLDAEPLQPALPRGGAGDDPALRRPGRSRSCRGARSRAGLLAGNRTREGERHHAARRPTSSARLCTGRRSTSRSSTGRRGGGRARGVPPAQVALAWLLHQPGVTAPIVGRDQGRRTSTTRSPPSGCTWARRS